MAYALSLQQPWAELVVSGRKTIETRKWNTKFRGEFYIHASKKINLQACKELEINPKGLITGALIGKAHLVETKKYNNQEEWEKDSEKHFAGWWKLDRIMYGFILQNIERIKPVQINGQLNFFKVNLK